VDESADFLSALAEYLARFLMASAQFVVVCLDKAGYSLMTANVLFQDAVLSPRLIYLVFFILTVQFCLGWVYIREEMKEMVRDSIPEIRLMLSPIVQTIQALWSIASNPWRVIGFWLCLVLFHCHFEIVATVSESILKVRRH
jgi:hypothetical protein